MYIQAMRDVKLLSLLEYFQAQSIKKHKVIIYVNNPLEFKDLG